jgi:hypothetical protein
VRPVLHRRMRALSLASRLPPSARACERSVCVHVLRMGVRVRVRAYVKDTIDAVRIGCRQLHSVACYLLHVACNLLHAICCVLHVAGNLLHSICCMLHVICCMLSVACCM